MFYISGHLILANESDVMYEYTLPVLYKTWLDLTRHDHTLKLFAISANKQHVYSTPIE